jgi:hypothetical protein
MTNSNPTNNLDNTRSSSSESANRGPNTPNMKKHKNEI